MQAQTIHEEAIEQLMVLTVGSFRLGKDLVGD
jgi:hypothetical protein